METELEYARRESRLRARARRMDLKVKKLRGGDGYLPYRIVDPFRNFIVAGGGYNGYGLTLDDVESALNED